MLGGFTSSAQAQYQFDTWTADTGLPQNIVRAVHQTFDGYLWVATLDGLARFDGVRFTVFNKSNSPGISSNRFTSLYEDQSGALWLGTENSGLTRYDRGQFYTFKVIAANRDGVWNTAGQNLRIRVTPPFYRAWWFLIIVAIGVTGLAALSYRSRIAGQQLAVAIVLLTMHKEEPSGGS